MVMAAEKRKAIPKTPANRPKVKRDTDRTRIKGKGKAGLMDLKAKAKAKLTESNLAIDRPILAATAETRP
jgi:hypothetical protein